MLSRPRKQPVGGVGDSRRVASQHVSAIQHQQNNQAPPPHQMPPQQPQQPQQASLSDLLRQLCDNLPNNNPIKQSYQTLLNHDQWPKKYVNHDFAPFRNLICFMLYIGWEDKSLGMTKKMLNWILNLLLTLQVDNIIQANYFIPKDASTILKYKRWFPDPPVC